MNFMPKKMPQVVDIVKGHWKVSAGRVEQPEIRYQPEPTSLTVRDTKC